jgi:hypothetical protein
MLIGLTEFVKNVGGENQGNQKPDSHMLMDHMDVQVANAVKNQILL